MNTMTINGHKAVITYDSDTDTLRGEFIGLNSGADFYAKDIDTLRKEGETSLRVYLDMCKERGHHALPPIFGALQCAYQPATARGSRGRRRCPTYQPERMDQQRHSGRRPCLMTPKGSPRTGRQRSLCEAIHPGREDSMLL